MQPAQATVLTTIDEALRFVLYGVSVLLDVDLRASEIERLFEASKAGGSLAQAYEFHRSPHVLITGRVDEYEPETVWISVKSKKFDQATLDRLVNAAKHASFGQRPGRRPT